MTDAYVGLGSNLGDRLANLAAAVFELSQEPGVRLRWVSHVYESEPWGVSDQPSFANAVAAIAYEGQADALLDSCKGIEGRLGREASARFGPRVIDLDILLFGDEEWVSPSLTIPHPRMLERDFVVTPLLEVAPAAALPDGSPVTFDAVTCGRVTGLLGALPGFEALTPGEGPDDSPDEDAGLVAGVPARVPLSPAEAAGEWVPVGPSRYEYATPNSSADFDVLLYEAALLQAGVPCEFYPHRPGEGASLPFGVRVEVRLMVPVSREREAREIVDAIGRGDAGAPRGGRL